MGAITAVISLLKKPEKSFDMLNKEKITVLYFSLALIIFSSIYGAIYGYLLDKIFQTSLAFAWKFPVTEILTILFATIPLYMLTWIFGSRDTVINAFSRNLVTFLVATLVMLAILPLNILYSLTDHSPVVLHIISIWLGGAASIRYLYLYFKHEKRKDWETVILIIVTLCILIFTLVQFVDLLFHPTPKVRAGILAEASYGFVEKASVVR